MKKFLCFILCLLLCLTASGASKKWVSYVNERFGYAIEYPNIFTQKKEPVNGDGVWLESKSGRTKLTLSGGFNVLILDGHDILKAHANQNTIKKECGSTWFRLINSEGGQITHEYGVVNDDTWASFNFSYPNTKNYDKEIQRMEKTLRLSD